MLACLARTQASGRPAANDQLKAAAGALRWHTPRPNHHLVLSSPFPVLPLSLLPRSPCPSSAPPRVSPFFIVRPTDLGPRPLLFSPTQERSDHRSRLLPRRSVPTRRSRPSCLSPGRLLAFPSGLQPCRSPGRSPPTTPRCASPRGPSVPLHVPNLAPKRPPDSPSSRERFSVFLSGSIVHSLQVLVWLRLGYVLIRQCLPFEPERRRATRGSAPQPRADDACALLPPLVEAATVATYFYISLKVGRVDREKEGRSIVQLGASLTWTWTRRPPNFRSSRRTTPPSSSSRSPPARSFVLSYRDLP